MYIYIVYLYICSHIYIYISKYMTNTHILYTLYVHFDFCPSFFTALPKFFNGRIAFSMGFKHVSCHQGWSLEILFIVNDGRLWKPSLPPGVATVSVTYLEGSVVFGAILFGRKNQPKKQHMYILMVLFRDDVHSITS